MGLSYDAMKDASWRAGLQGPDALFCGYLRQPISAAQHSGLVSIVGYCGINDKACDYEQRCGAPFCLEECSVYQAMLARYRKV